MKQASETKDFAALQNAQREIDRELVRTLNEAQRLTKLSEEIAQRIERAQERTH